MNQFDKSEAKRPETDLTNRTGKPEVSVHVVASTVNYAISCGIPMSKISELTGIKRTQLIDEESRMPEDVILKIWSLHAKTDQKLSPGLHMAMASPDAILGPARNVFRFAATFREAINAFISYQSILADRLELKLLESDSVASLETYHPMDELDTGNVVEVGYAKLTSLLRDCVCEEHLIGIDFTHSPCGDVDAYNAFFGVPVRFNQKSNKMHLRREALDSKMRESDAELLNYVKHNLDLVLDRWQLSGDRQLMSQILAVIQSNAELCDFSANGLANSMAMSLRKLQRSTQEFGFTIRGLLEEAREVRACYLLSKTDLDLETIASRLGYADSRSFRRAFSRWKAQSPTEFRNEYGSNALDSKSKF